MQNNKPIIGFTCGDINGIGPEIILKLANDPLFYQYCTPLFLGSLEVLEFYKTTIPNLNISLQKVEKLSEMQGNKQLFVYDCYAKREYKPEPGKLTSEAGALALSSLKKGAELLRANKIQALITLPINKANTHSEDFPYAGHTPFLQNFFAVQQVVMLMISEAMRVALVTEHVPIAKLVEQITMDKIIAKARVLHQCLRKDFAISHPNIAILGLNPHCGDNGLVGREEQTIIKPAITQLQEAGIRAFGPYAADGFFAQGAERKFDAVLAMYHDQGLIPFKSIGSSYGVNYTAGLPVIRISPDHGTAFDIAGQNRASEASLRTAMFCAIDILRSRNLHAES